MNPPECSLRERLAAIREPELSEMLRVAARRDSVLDSTRLLISPEERAQVAQFCGGANPALAAAWEQACIERASAGGDRPTEQVSPSQTQNLWREHSARFWFIVGFLLAAIVALVAIALSVIHSRHANSDLPINVAPVGVTVDTTVSPRPILTPNNDTAAAVMPPECARLPPGPDRKSCLIRAADDERQNLKQAEQIYRLAIAETYDSNTAPTHAIDDGYMNPEWPHEASGPRLLAAQQYSAQAGLASLFALHGHYPQAAEAWSQAEVTIPSAFEFGRTCTEAFVEDYLNLRGGTSYRSSDSCRMSGDGDRYRQSVYFQRASAAGNWLRVMDQALMVVGLDYRPYPELERDYPGNSRYWRGILPEIPQMIAAARQAASEAKNRLLREKTAFEVSNVVFWVSDSYDQLGASIVEQPPEEQCIEKMVVNEPKAFCYFNRPSWYVHSLESTEYKMDFAPPGGIEARNIFTRSAYRPAKPIDIAATIAMYRCDNGKYFERCNARKVWVRYCLTPAGSMFKTRGQECSNN